MSSLISRLAACGIAALTGLWGAGAAWAQSGADFFTGKTVTYIVATEPGGGYDTNGRLIAEFMQKHLPGSTFVVQNMPGAGHLIGTNYLYASEPDGLTFGTFNTGLIYRQLAGDKAIKFDLGKMSWIGKVASEPRVIVMSKQSGIDNFAQLKTLKEPIKFAAAGFGSASAVEMTMLVNTVGLKIEVITGYNGNDDQLALRRGEVQGILGSRSTFAEFVKEGHGKFIAQIGGSETDVPQLATLVEGDDAQRALALIASQSNIARLSAGPPGIPQDRLTALRDAYAAAVSDPEFLKKAQSLGLPVDPLVGQAVADAVFKALDQKPEMIEFLKVATKKKKD
ncbi:MAG TPA: tripartite tricarboxylate transporter substrate-binding protein [Nordella sp.]|nr:tripartite tricarboxylate transporter substrate-binding protein [Nordella sp.]